MRGLANKISKLKIVLIISLCSIINNAQGNISAELKPVGQATMSWFFIDIYQASLYSQSGQYQEQYQSSEIT